MWVVCALFELHVGGEAGSLFERSVLSQRAVAAMLFFFGCTEVDLCVWMSLCTV